jgi:hypothetical protein
MIVVLPLVDADLDRYTLVNRPSLERFYRDLDEVWIITRRSDLRAVRNRVGTVGVRVTDERALVPEEWLRWDPRPARVERRRTEPTNWYFQQLLKLAAIAEIHGDFALTMDADVFAVREFDDDDLVRGGRALRPREPRIKYPDWVADAAATLGTHELDYQAAVTPCVLSRDVVRLLARYVTEHVPVRGPRLTTLAKVPLVRGYASSWRGRLLGHKWTEYQIYDTFVRDQDLWDRYHFLSDDPVFLGNEVHQADEFPDWSPVPPPEGPIHWFSLVQSRSGIPAEPVARRIRESGLLDP